MPTQPPTDSSQPKTAAKAPKPTKADQMTPELLEFIQAVDQYKRIHGRPFPSWGEVLTILSELGYAKWDGDEPIH
ncbi:MAG: hypothetical protein OSB57_08760 [Planctomycetota bacterium]|nr:hypothetical protein [Planctomycetota bacterium]